MSISIQPFDAHPFALRMSPSEGISRYRASQMSFLKGKTVSYFNFLYQ